LDTRVSIEQGRGKGKITIEFSGNEDLQRIVDLIEG
jgi:ParB family chromosome partitioning protein